MTNEQNIIVAIEFGSSAVCGMAGYRKPDGSLCIKGLEHERIPEAVQKGLVYNLDLTTQAISNIIGRLNDRLGVSICKAYVGLTGQSLRSELNVIHRQLATKVKIAQDIIDALLDENSEREYPNAEVLAVVPQEYTVANHAVQNALGVQGEDIEARYLNIVAKSSIRENIRKCMRGAGLEIAGTMVAPMALADALLPDSEKRSGCALVDFGAETTTVSVYTSNLLRHLVVIPMGGANITADIVNGKQVYVEEAEAMKRKHGVAYTATDNPSPASIPVSNNRHIDENELQTIIGARQEEIIANVWEQVRPYAEQLLAGIVTTGGAAQMRDMGVAMRHFTNFERVKAAKSLVTAAEVMHGIDTPQDLSIDTLIALLLAGNENCIGEVYPPDPEEEDEREIDLTEQQTEIEDVQDEEPEQKPKKDWKKKVRKMGAWLKDHMTDDEEEQD